MARQQLVSGDAEGKDVGQGVGIHPLQLIGRHVFDGAEDEARRGVARPGRIQIAGDAEIENLGAAVVEQHHVGGLHVAVYHALLVREAQPLGDLEQDAHLFKQR
jgi:hypothetical protein